MAAGTATFSLGGLHEFLDPMRGSGTLAIEAAMIACNIPANINRTRFVFKNWNNYDEDLFETIVNSSSIRPLNTTAYLCHGQGTFCGEKDTRKRQCRKS